MGTENKLEKTSEEYKLGGSAMVANSLTPY